MYEAGKFRSLGERVVPRPQQPDGVIRQLATLGEECIAAEVGRGCWTGEGWDGDFGDRGQL
jgi:hypothetical protein